MVKFQGESVLTASQLSRLVRDVPSGRKVDIDLIRAGAPVKVTATLVNGEWSSDGMDRPELADLDKRLSEKMGKLGETEVRDVSDLQEAVRDLEPGKTSPMTVWRDGKSVDLSVTVDLSQQSKSQPRPSRRPVS